MKQYFYSNDKVKYGPYSFEDLKMKDDISPNTLIWHEDLKDWTAAKELDELVPILELKPPPLPSSEYSYNEFDNINNLKIDKNLSDDSKSEYYVDQIPNSDTSTNSKLKTKWLSFVAYIQLPIISLTLIIGNFSIGRISFLSVIICAISFSLIYGIHCRKNFTYNLFIFNSIFYPIWYSFIMSEFLSIKEFFIKSVIFTLIWGVPNIFYIIKRKKLFI